MLNISNEPSVNDDTPSAKKNYATQKDNKSSKPLFLFSCVLS